MRMRFLLPLLIATTLNPMNSSMLAVALTPISRAFPDDAATAAWLVTVLYLTAAVAQPVLGRIADRVGARRTLLAGLLVVALGGIAGGVAATMPALIFSRCLIGIGTAAGFPCAIVMIRERADSLGVEPPARMLGLLSLASSVSTALGPTLGGFIIAWFGWRWIFLVNLPLAILGLALVAVLLPRDPARRPHERISFDVPGIVLFSLGMAALMLFLMRLASRVDPVPLLAAILLLGALVLVELRQRAPFIDVRMVVTNRALAATYGRHVVLNLVLYGMFYTLPQCTQLVLGWSATASGMILLPMALLAGITSLAPTRGRAGRRAVLAGSAGLILSCAALFLLSPGISPILVLLVAALFGAANGTLSMANQQRLLDYAPADQAGTAAGLLRTAQYCGAILSSALTAIVLSEHASQPPMQFLGLALLPLACFFALLVFRKDRRSETAVQ